jgi:hypothetical protein
MQNQRFFIIRQKEVCGSHAAAVAAREVIKAMEIEISAHRKKREKKPRACL